MRQGPSRDGDKRRPTIETSTLHEAFLSYQHEKGKIMQYIRGLQRYGFIGPDDDDDEDDDFDEGDDDE